MTDLPPPQPALPEPGGPGRAQLMLFGLLAGVVLGAGSLGLAWAVAADEGTDADAEAVCGIIERTEIPGEDTPVEELRRWGVTEVAPSLAAREPEYRELADALEQAARAVRNFDRDEIERAATRVKELCADL
ncbi:hypothetical protein [Actinophytocola xanthii]|uniref:Uncharacterized protein n=1 Tax=Actinophytocola xanthii TaxID=1912961 RepID=A0A1Q8C7S8_9PSEU|nr:hypothetical protein [Actinophytocola xanthii]OLF10410.1 hypothetical protein BU204_31515 [Actinophytocola xanthii]